MLVFSRRLTSLPRAKTPRRTSAPTSTILGATPEYLARRYVSLKKATRPIKDDTFFHQATGEPPFLMGYSVMLALRAAINAARAGGAGANSWFKLGIAVVLFLPPQKKRFT